MKKKIWMVDTCKGTKYYTKELNAKQEFYNNKLAHTLAKKIYNTWCPILEKIIIQKLNLN